MYNDYFGLSERPFQLTPDPRFWFESATHRKAMAYLGYGLAQGEGFIVITGEIGAGKTTLVGHLIATIDADRFTSIRIVSTQVEGDDMLRLVARGIGLSTEGVAKAQVLDRIERSLDDQMRAGKHVLLIVDEAQNLPISALEELRMLSNYQAAGKPPVQIILLGQPEFRDHLRDLPELEQLRQRVIATHHLDPMGAQEIEGYIRHRLVQAGYQGRPGFEPECFVAIHRATGGIPRKINALMARVLLAAAIDERETIDTALIALVIADGSADSGVPAVPASSHVQSAVAPDRLSALEARLDQQETALRRVLSILIDWIEKEDEAAPLPSVRRSGSV